MNSGNKTAKQEDIKLIKCQIQNCIFPEISRNLNVFTGYSYSEQMFFSKHLMRHSTWHLQVEIYLNICEEKICFENK